MHDRQRGQRVRRRGRGERGAALVEFALIGPLLVLLLLGIVDFGINLSNQIALRQGVREAARQGVVGNFGEGGCGTSATGSDDLKRLVCLTKDRSDLTGTDVAVAIFEEPAVVPAGSGGPPPDLSLVVCGVAPLQSLSKMFAPVLDGRYLRTRTVMRLEQPLDQTAGPNRAVETDPTGEGWAWCAP